MNVGCSVGDTIINHLIYADDLVIFAPSSVGLNKLLQICEKFGIDNDVLFNSSKSAIMLFKSRFMNNFNRPNFTLNNNVIEYVESFKYLGHVINSDLSDKQDIQRQIAKLYAQGNSLIRKFFMCTMGTKIMLFTSYCSSMYAVQLWANYTASSIKKLHTAYHNIFKTLIGVSRREHTSPIFVNLRLRTCQAVIRNLVDKFMNRLKSSENNLIKSISSNYYYHNSPFWRHWRSLLYIL